MTNDTLAWLLNIWVVVIVIGIMFIAWPTSRK